MESGGIVARRSEIHRKGSNGGIRTDAVQTLRHKKSDVTSNPTLHVTSDLLDAFAANEAALCQNAALLMQAESTQNKDYEEDEE